jgi:hypothetical protein
MLQNIKDLVSTLWFEKDKKKARDIGINLANQLLLLMGAPEKKIKLLKDIYNAALPPSYFNNQKIESWFEPHPFFNGPVALKLYDDKNSAFESSFFHLSETATKARIAATTLLGINWEDLEIYELPKYKVGIDFFLNFESNSLLLVISRRGNVRVIEFSERLTHTQEEILQKLSESNGVLAFEGFDLKTGQLLPREPQKTIHEILWKELQVNEVNKKFYSGIAEHFDQLSTFIHSSKQVNDHKDAQIFSSRLIGRLLFIWFLRKMNFINAEPKYFDLESLNSTDYYEKKLKPLFFEVLNTPVEDRKFKDKKTPFLNGGLFESNFNDFSGKKLILPNNFFSNLYNHLNSFNFTVDESTPEYEQVAIDPEMLGRVFENLLASIVPETASAANERKNKGAFYTPREIVSYMCRESLKEFFRAKINDDSLDEGISKLIDLNDAKFIELKSTGIANLWGVRSKEVVPKMIEFLNEIKVFDPACGSGAFPIGMLQLISRTFDRLNAKFDKNTKKHILATGKSTYDRYDSKLSIISNNLYGSDIEPMAIEISRLRSWLSLVIEEKSTIHPLPNLDFNFICSNSLIMLDDNIDLFEGDFQEKFAELKNLYFSTHNKTSKINLRNSFEKLYGVFYDINKNSNKTNQLKSWNPFDTSKPALFFDAKTMFNFSKFDIVIANPPYIDYRKIDNLTKINLGNTYKISRHSKMINIYTYFFELGLSLLSESGNLCYISPQQFLIYSNTKGLRDLIRNYSVVSFDNFSNVKVFDADTYPFISIISKKTKKTFTYKEFSSIDFDNKAKRIEIFPNPISEPVSFSKHLELINRLSKNNSKLKNYIDEIFVGTSSTPNRRNVPEKNSLQFVESSNIFEYKIFNLVYYINKDEYPTESLNKQENSSLIYISRMTSRIRSVVIENSKYLAGKVNVILASNKNIYFLCALLNSNLINFWFREYFLLQHLQGGALPINSEDIMIIPYPVINEDKKIKLFDEIVKISKKNHTVELIDSQRIEYSQKIDNLIYDLFGLRPSEILLVEEAMK